MDATKRMLDGRIILKCILRGIGCEGVDCDPVNGFCEHFEGL
jgi:hypothetical protein